MFDRLFTGELVRIFILSTDFVIKLRKNTILFYNTIIFINKFLCGPFILYKIVGLPKPSVTLGF